MAERSGAQPQRETPRGTPAVEAIPIDPIADAALQVRLYGPPRELRCDACEAELDGEPGGRGLLMWSRGGDMVFEEPVLCEACATAIGMTAHRHWHVEEEDE